VPNNYSKIDPIKTRNNDFMLNPNEMPRISDEETLKKFGAYSIDDTQERSYSQLSKRHTNSVRKTTG